MPPKQRMKPAAISMTKRASFDEPIATRTRHAHPATTTTTTTTTTINNPYTLLTPSPSSSSSSSISSKKLHSKRRYLLTPTSENDVDHSPASPYLLSALSSSSSSSSSLSVASLLTPGPTPEPTNFSPYERRLRAVGHRKPSEGYFPSTSSVSLVRSSSHRITPGMKRTRSEPQNRITNRHSSQIENSTPGMKTAYRFRPRRSRSETRSVPNEVKNKDVRQTEIRESKSHRKAGKSQRRSAKKEGEEEEGEKGEDEDNEMEENEEEQEGEEGIESEERNSDEQTEEEEEEEVQQEKKKSKNSRKNTRSRKVNTRRGRKGRHELEEEEEEENNESETERDEETNEFEDETQDESVADFGPMSEGEGIEDSENEILGTEESDTDSLLLASTRYQRQRNLRSRSKQPQPSSDSDALVPNSESEERHISEDDDDDDTDDNTDNERQARETARRRSSRLQRKASNKAVGEAVAATLTLRSLKNSSASSCLFSDLPASNSFTTASSFTSTVFSNISNNLRPRHSKPDYRLSYHPRKSDTSSNSSNSHQGGEHGPGEHSFFGNSEEPFSMESGNEGDTDGCQESPSMVQVKKRRRSFQTFIESGQPKVEESDDDVIFMGESRPLSKRPKRSARHSSKVSSEGSTSGAGSEFDVSSLGSSYYSSDADSQQGFGTAPFTVLSNLNEDGSSLQEQERQHIKPEKPVQASLYSPCDSQKNEMDEIERKVWGWTIEREAVYLPLLNKIEKNKDFTQSFRRILLDWVFEVAQEFKLHRETAHMCINYIDRYLCATENVKKSQLQLIGVTSLFIASKLEEIYPPNVKDFSAVTDGLFSMKDIHDMELKILDKLKWKLIPPTCNFWVNFYLQNQSRVIGVQCDQALLETTKDLKHFLGPLFLLDAYLRAMSLADACLHEFDSLKFPYSLLAATAVCLTADDNVQKNAIYKASGFSKKQLQDCQQWMSNYLQFPGVNTARIHHTESSPTNRFNLQTHNENLLAHFQRHSKN